MIESHILEQLQKAPLEERIAIIEMLLRSLKAEIAQTSMTHQEPENSQKRPGFGCMANTGHIRGDIVAPALAENAWEVLQ